MRTVFKVGAEIETLTKDELESVLERRADAETKALIRGVKWVEVEQTVSPGLNQITVAGPQQGYTWDLKLVSVQLSASSTGGFDIYKGEQVASVTAAAARRQIFNATAAQQQYVATWSSHQVILRPGEGITLDAVLSTALITEYFIAAVEIPAERLGELLI